MTQAAKRLNVVQPALSQSIARLEDELGVVLFVRSRKGMELTTAGEEFLKHAYGIFRQYNRAKASLSNFGGPPSGEVSVAITASALEVLVEPMTSMLEAQFPEIVLNLDSGLAGNIQQGFDAGRYDLVVSHLVKKDPAIVIEDLIEEDLYLATQYDADIRTTEIEFELLKNYSLILPQPHHAVAAEVNEQADSRNFKIEKAQISGALHPTLRLIEIGKGASILPWSTLHERVKNKVFTARKIVNPTLSHRLSIIYPSNRPQTPASIAVKDVIQASTKQVHKDGLWNGNLLFD